MRRIPGTVYLIITLSVQSNRPQKPFPISLLLVGEHKASQKCNGSLRGN